MNSKRNELVDEIRFICAIFVIAIHTKLGFENNMDIFSDNSKDGCSLLSSSNWMVFLQEF